MKDNKMKMKKIWGICVFLLTPVVAFLAMEYASPAGPALIWAKLTKASAARSAASVLFLWLLMTTAYAFLNSMRLAGSLLCVLAAVFAYANVYVYRFRGVPLLASDLTNAGTALAVAGNYDYTPNRRLVIMTVVMVIWIVLLCTARQTKIPKGRKRAAFAIGMAAFCALVCTTLMETPVLRGVLKVKINTFRPIKSYTNNGAVLTMLRSIQMMQVEKPEGYSEEKLEEIASAYREKETEDYVTPNVIAIMDEAFTDFSAVGEGLRTNEDILPFYHSLTENTVKGHTYVSVLGGQTANTEFEFLTGLSKSFLMEGVTPYSLYIKKELPSLASALDNRGYQGILAFHPFRANGYNRSRVYPLLGFADFISVEDITYEKEDLLRGFLSDKADFDLIIEEYEKARAISEEPFFLFNVTMQNHSGYEADYENFVQSIEIEDMQDASAKRFINLMHYTDEALRYLIAYFEQVEEPTVIVVFGDHQPKLSDEFYMHLLGKDKDDLTEAENLELYKTPFLIWANYDIEEREDVSVSANYLSVLMAQAAGMELTPFQKFLAEMAQEIPVLTSNGYLDAQGEFYRVDDETSPYYEKLQTYAMLQYNDLFDGKNRIEDFFE